MTKEIIINAPEGANIEGLQIEQTATKPSDAINSALAEYNYGSNDTTEQKELLQLQSHRD